MRFKLNISIFGSILILNVKVAIGHYLQPLQREIFAPKSIATDDARLDIKANGLREVRFNKTIRCENF